MIRLYLIIYYTKDLEKLFVLIFNNEMKKNKQTRENKIWKNQIKMFKIIIKEKKIRMILTYIFNLLKEQDKSYLFQINFYVRIIRI